MQTSLKAIFEEFQPSGVLKEMQQDDVQITGIGSVEDCGPGDLVFIGKPEFLNSLKGTPAAAVVSPEVAGKLEGTSYALVTSDNVNLAQALIKQAYGDRDLRDEEWGRVHPSAVVHKSVRIPDSVVIGPGAIIGRDVELGDNAVIMANTVVEFEAKIGRNSVLHPNVVFGYRCTLGDNCIIKSGAVIGSEGFGFAQDEKRKHHRIPQTGIVAIEDRCVIGTNNTIDRAAYGVTRIKSGCIFDNLCHIAHNVELGDDCIIVAQTGIAGSTVLGNRVICSGQTGILDHLYVPDDTVLLHRAAVVRKLRKSGVYASLPLVPINDYMRNSSVIANIADLKKQVVDLEKKLKAISESAEES